MIERLHNINGKLDMLQELKIQGLGLSLDQQEALLAIHQQILDQRFELLKQIKKEYIL
jgi:hydrogenase maturation factor HypE